MSELVSVIGDGAMGTVCAIILAENGYRVRLWSAFDDAAKETAAARENLRFLPGYPLPDAIEVTGSDAGVFDDASWAVSAVPTQYTRGCWQRLVEHCPKNLPICSISKGIENNTLLRPTQILADVLGDRKLATLSGPSIAPEVADHMPATLVAAGVDEDFVRTIQESFTRPWFRVYTNGDILGVELAGATKNVIAIAAGILDGLGMGDNAKAALLTRGLAEISRLGLAMGAKAETFAGLAGVGDLVTTCISPMGRNRSFGQGIGEGQNVAQASKLAGEDGAVIEGVATTESVMTLASKIGVEMPITQAIHDVLFSDKNPALAIDDLMSRPMKKEFLHP